MVYIRIHRDIENKMWFGVDNSYTRVVEKWGKCGKSFL
jgi:hypothetical protein